MKVVKHSGEVVDFEKVKLERSLLKAGADQPTIQSILKNLATHLYDGMTTQQIYKLAFDRLKEESSAKAARYNLRASFELLGPAGFYFEKYISHLFRVLGYATRMNLNLHGKCIEHEVDLVIKKDNKLTMVECKFHANRDIVSDVKVPMYTLSRFNDLKERSHSIFEQEEHINVCLIATNNRFSEDAIQFAECAGLQLLSWSYPSGNNLHALIDKTGLYPITCLTTMSRNEKEQLLSLDVIVANQLKTTSDDLNHIGLSAKRIKNILQEVSELCT
ncbi:ATP cone domain-containing protein [Flavobacterium sp. GCM10023249]|uniref:ATP cone domain-containing protein n=1 Tax=unclassified Flavobacterium TaxID=196869 RepID=UPI003622260D